MRLLIENETGEGLDLGGLATRFQISRHSADAIGLAKISVFNLTDATIAKMQGRYTKITLEAGYPQRSGVIFKGEIRNVFPVKDGVDRITDIFAADAASDYAESFVNITFPAGSTLKDIVTTVASTFKHTSVGSLEFLTDKAIVGSLTLSGMTRTVMNELKESHGFRWTIQGGVLQVIDVGAVDGQSAIEVSRETGMIDTPLANTNGVEILTLLDHRLIPGRRINVTSAGAQVAVADSTLQIAKDFVVRGRTFFAFDVLRVLHIGESRGQTWYTKAYAMPSTAEAGVV